MTLIKRAVPAALILAALIATALYVGAAPAWAHVEVEANNTARGGEAILTFQVPNESDTGALTTQFSVALPNVTSAATELMSGWTARLDRDTAAGTTRSVTWTAAPGVGIARDQFALFRVAVTLPNTDTVSLPATQTYDDGTVVHWDQPPRARWRRARTPGADADADPSRARGRQHHRRCRTGKPPGRAGAGFVAAGARHHRPLAGRRRTARGRARGRAGAGQTATVMRTAAAALLGALLAVIALDTAPTASAHATRIATDPAVNAVLTTGPSQVSATFNEHIQPTFAAMTVVGPNGNLWSTGQPRVQGAVISIDVLPLGPAGTYTVNYRVTSADGHVVSGSWPFQLTTAGTGRPGPSAAAPAASGGIPVWPFLAIGVVLVAGGAWWALRRRRPRSG